MLRCRPWRKVPATLKARTLSCQVDADSPVAVATRLIIQQCKKTSRWTWAIQSFKELSEKVTPDVVCFTAVIGICSKASAWQQGLLLLQQMGKVKVLPNLITYNSLVAASSRSGEWQLAFELIREMDNVAVMPDQVTYNTTLVALRKAGLSRQALRASTSLVKPDAADPYTYCALISACKKTAKWAKALNLVDDAMRRFSKLNKYVLSAGIAACAKGLQPHQAVELFNLAQDSTGVDAISRDAAISACAATFLWAEAVNLLNSNGTRRSPPGVQSLLGAAFATASSSSAPDFLANRMSSAAQKKASQELRRQPQEEGTWHDAILAESLVNYPRFAGHGQRFMKERGRLLRMLQAYVLSPVLTQLSVMDEKSTEKTCIHSHVLQQQYGFGGLCKELALQLGVEYPRNRLPSQWMGPEAVNFRRRSRNYGIVLPREPVAQELFVCLDYSLFPKGKHCAEHLHVSYADRSKA